MKPATGIRLAASLREKVSRKSLVRILACVACGLFALPGAAAGQRKAGPVVVRTVKPERVRNQRLESAIVRAFAEDRDPSRGEICYYYNFVDLNGDGKPEALVYLFGPSICGTGGCLAEVYSSGKRRFELVSDIELARNPIIVSQHATRGWRDLIMFTFGGSTEPGYYAVLRFNGRRYAVSASLGSRSRRVRGTAYLAGEGEAAAADALRLP